MKSTTVSGSFLQISLALTLMIFNSLLISIISVSLAACFPHGDRRYGRQHSISMPSSGLSSFIFDKAVDGAQCQSDEMCRSGRCSKYSERLGRCCSSDPWMKCQSDANCCHNRSCTDEGICVLFE